MARNERVDGPIAKGTAFAYDAGAVRSFLVLLLGVASLATPLVACESDPPPAKIPLARLTGSGCVAWEGQPVDRVCVPRTARENSPLVLEVEERCGTCSTSVEKCTVSVEGRDITLSLDGRSCHVSSSCADVCIKRRIACRVPALGGGRYTLRYADGSGRMDVLEVGAGGAPSCTLDDGA